MLNNFSLPLFAVTLIVVFFGMGLHEFGHALMADWWGDPTPRRNGKLTPNPLAHINPVGWVFYTVMALGFIGQSTLLLVLILIIMIAFARSRGGAGGAAIGAFSLGYVHVNSHLMRNPRWGNFWTSFAGPLANLFQALVAAMALRLLTGALHISMLDAYLLAFRPQMIATPVDYLLVFLAVAITVNCSFFVFNILPLAPLDGWNMVYSLLPGYFLTREQVPVVIRQNMRPLALFLQQPAVKWRDWYQLSSIIFLALFLIGLLPGMPGILGMIISPPASFLIRILIGF